MGLKPLNRPVSMMYGHTQVTLTPEGLKFLRHPRKNFETPYWLRITPLKGH